MLVKQHRTGIENDGVSTLSWSKNLQESSLSLTNAKSVFSLIALQPRGDERPSHEALFRTILSLLTVHVACNFNCEVMAAMQISASSVCPFDELKVVYLHCIYTLQVEVSLFHGF